MEEYWERERQRRMGNTQRQMLEKRQSHETTLNEALLMIRDRIGTTLNLVERMLFSLQQIEHPDEFKFHGFSPERLVEHDSDLVSEKLILVYRTLIATMDEIQNKFSSEDEARLMNVFYSNKLETGYIQWAQKYFERVDLIGDDHALEKDLLKQVLNAIIKGNFEKLKNDIVLKLKAAINSRKGDLDVSFADQSRLMKVVNQAHQHMDDSIAYLKNSGGKQPNTAYEPATRAYSSTLVGDYTYIGERSRLKNRSQAEGPEAKSSPTQPAESSENKQATEGSANQVARDERNQRNPPAPESAPQIGLGPSAVLLNVQSSAQQQPNPPTDPRSYANGGLAIRQPVDTSTFENHRMISELHDSPERKFFFGFYPYFYMYY
jgi:hypothetical protein